MEHIVDFLYSAVSTMWANYKMKKYGFIQFDFTQLGIRIVLYSNNKSQILPLED